MMKPGRPKAEHNLESHTLLHLNPDKHHKALQYANRIAIHIVHNNADASHELVELAVTDVQDKNPLDPLLTTMLADLLPIRITNMLAERGITNVEQMLGTTTEQLRTIPNFGDMSIIECYRAVAKRCIRITLKQETMNGR